MSSMFEQAASFLGLSLETFEAVFSAAFILLLLLVAMSFISLRRRSARVVDSKARITELEDEISDAEKRLKSAEKERQDIARQHEEALSKLKEAKEVILKREQDFNSYKANFQGDVEKISVMEEELKSYRIKLGELNKEKEELMARYEGEKRTGDENQKKLNDKFEKEIEAQKKKIASAQKELEEEMQRKERAHEKRVEEIKMSAKDAMIKLTKEKDREMDDLKLENERLKGQVEKLKDELRVLEIEKL